MAQLVTIGSFSELCGLSAKVLRSYGDDGLLEPAAIDRTNGYRYYDRSQVDRARLIGLLRRAGVPLTDIRSVLERPQAATFDVLDADLDEELTVRRSALTAARRLAALSEPPPPTAPAPDPPGGSSMTLTMHAAHTTHLGHVRTLNQDAVAATERLVVVADGFGPAGAEVSAETVAAIAKGFSTSPTVDGLGAAMDTVNDSLIDRGRSDSGTTVVALGVGGADRNQVVVGHVGDSRLYRVRRGRLEQLTIDHSVVAELIADGTVEPNEWAGHPQRHILTSALGSGRSFACHLQAFDGHDGDRYLLCTDGLPTEVGDDEIASILSGSADADGAAAALVAAAVDRGGNDNVTAAVVDIFVDT